MNHNTFISKMHDAGDAYVFYITPVSKKTKYHICTLDLKNTKYIADKLTDKDNTELSDNLVRIFSWDLDTFKVIDSSLVTKVVPLSTVLAQSNLIAEQPKYKRN